MTDQTIRDRAAQVIGDAHAAWCKDDYPRELYAEDAILDALDAAGIGLYDRTTSVLLGSGNVTGKAPGFDPDAAG
jgi:hypothetical protein